MKSTKKICKSCGREINEADGDMVFTVNPGLPSEYVECECCHDLSWDDHKIIHCAACGGWFTPDAIHEEEVAGDTFCACPSCGKDMVDGTTRAEFEDERFVPKYAAVVSFCNMTRGYQIAANGTNEAMEKLLKHIGESGMTGVTAVHISEILLGNDIIS